MMRSRPIFALLVLSIACLIVDAPALAQSGGADTSATDTDIMFVQEIPTKQVQVREQLRRLLNQYDLDPWIVTRAVRIELEKDPHSKPVLSLNASNLENDLAQLSTFIHEQMHWYVGANPEAAAAAVEDLKETFPDIPQGTDHRSSRMYQHIIVEWLVQDAMTELVGSDKALQVQKEDLRKKAQRLEPGEPIPPVGKAYKWYHDRALEDTKEVGAILAEHGLVITPEKGIVVKAE